MLTQARLLIGSLVVLIVVIGAGLFWWQWNSAKAARARAVVAERGQELAEQTTGITERTLRTEVVIHQTAERQADAIQTAPGAETVLDPAFARELERGIGVMRGEPQGSDDTSSSGSERALP